MNHPRSVSEPLDEIKPIAQAFHVKGVDTHFRRLIEGQKPHIICLQEYTAHADYDSVRVLLNEKGYDIYGQSDTAVAVKRDEFDILQHGSTFDSEHTREGFGLVSSG